MKHSNFEAVRRIIFKKLDTSRMFAFWRVEPPWQPMTKKGVGKRMGGGKGSAHHYATPVKAERIIIELGGNLDAHEVIIINITVLLKKFLKILYLCIII